MSEHFDIVICGDIVGLDTLFAEHLLSLFPNMKVLVIRKKWGKKQSIKDLPEYFHIYDLNEIRYVDNSYQFIQLCKKSRLVLSIGGAFITFSRLYYFLKSLMKLPPLINLTVGSDFLESLPRSDWFGYIYRNFLNFSSMNIIGAAPQHIELAIRRKVKNVYLMNIPYMVPVLEKVPENNKEIIFFHPSHLDFGISDNGKHRKIHKGNDKFLKAFIKALDSGLNAKCIILDRGADKELAKQMIKEKGYENQFLWKPHLDRKEYLAVIRSSDVVVDQFVIGAIGMIALESMSQEKPVITYVNKPALRVQYNDDLPPVLNGYSESDIYDRIMECGDRKYLNELGQKGRDWVIRNHRWDKCLDEFLFHYQRLTGHCLINYVEEK